MAGEFKFKLLFVILFVIHRKKANKYFRNKLKGGPNFDFILRNTSAIGNDLILHLQLKNEISKKVLLPYQ
jgi:hypothetical protein